MKHLTLLAFFILAAQACNYYRTTTYTYNYYYNTYSSYVSYNSYNLCAGQYCSSSLSWWAKNLE